MSTGSVVVVKEQLMGAGTWSAIIDHTPVIYDLLWDAANKRPHDLWALIYDDTVGGDLLYPPLHLFQVDGDEEGLLLGGLGSLWALGSNGVGPIIAYREYISGEDKLSNGSFDLSGLYWRRPSEDSRWVFVGGAASNVGGLRTDDVLEYDLPFPTRPGDTYQAAAVSVVGTGNLRIRTIYTGRFNPPNLLTDWLTVDALTIGPVTKPQLISGSEFASGAGWTLGPTMTITGGALVAGPNPQPNVLNFAAGPSTLGSTMTFAGGVLTAGPNPQPQYIADPGFETGTGWTAITTPAPMSPDIELVNSPAEASSGNWVMQVGPVTQHGLLFNADFATNLDNWYMSSTDADPDPGVFYWFATDGVDGTGGATTAGTTTPVPLAITDQGEYESWLASQGGGRFASQVNPFMFEFNGTSYATFEANSLADPNRGAATYVQDFDGAWVLESAGTTHVPLTYTSRASVDSWLASMPNGTSYSTFEANDLADANRGAAGYIQDFDGSWVEDNPTTKYLRSDASSGTGGAQAYDVKPGEQYEVSAQVRRSPGADGFAYISAHIPHPTVANREQWFTSSTVKSEELPGETFERLKFTVNIPDNRFKMDNLFEVHKHTAEFWTVDNFFVTRTRGNRAQYNSDATYTVVPGTPYRLSAMARSGGDMQVGSIRLGVILSGPGVPDEIIDVDKGSTDYEWTLVHFVFTPETGYTTARLFVAALDVIGDPAWLDYMTLHKNAGNQDISTFAPAAVVPDQRYLLQVEVEAASHEGSVAVGVILTGPAVVDEYITLTLDSKDHTSGTHALKTEVRPAPGYTFATLYVQSTDIPVDEPGAFVVNSATLTKSDGNLDISSHTGVLVTPDQRYLMQAEVEVVDAKSGTITVGVALDGGGPTQFVTVGHSVGDGVGIRMISVEVKPAPGYIAAQLYVQSTDILGGTFEVLRATLTKMDNNTAETVGTAIDVTPERTYKWAQTVRSGANLQRGTVKLSVACKRTGHDDIVFDSPAMEATNADRKVLEFDVTPPSGYDQILPTAIGTDVEGDDWTLGMGELRDTDTGTVVFDAVAANPALASPFVNSTAPEGAESVRVAVVAEEGSTGWNVAAVRFKRTGETPATGNAIVADLLTDPTTGLPLPIDAGTLSAPAVIPYDWTVQNLTNRAALDHLCGVVYDPPLEYKLEPATPPTLTVGPASDIFATHDPADALLPEDIDVEDLSDPESDVSDRPTQVTVLGAELATVSGRPVLITATMPVPGTTRLDLNGNPVIRTKQVSSGTVDHAGYAVGLASDEATREANPPVFLTAKLSGKDTRADSPPGDTVYVHHPEAGVFDLDVTTTIEGATVHPRAVRVLERERTHGPSHRIVMLRPDGTTFPLPGVRWSDEDATVLSVGDRLPEWLADPQGTSEGEEYLRDRASRPR